MIDTLQKMSGTTHKAFRESKSVTEDKSKLFMRVKSEVGYTISVKEVPVISYNDMAFISERNSIVFRAGDAPIWNRNEMILPMSWRLFSNTITHPGHDYSLQTIPTLSSAMDFDVRKNQPDFSKMLTKRMDQYCVAEKAREAYKKAYGLESDFEIAQLDPDLYADEIMSIINTYVRNKQDKENPNEAGNFDHTSKTEGMIKENSSRNDEQLAETAKAQAQMESRNQKRYAGGLLSREDLVPQTGGGAAHQLDKMIAEAYARVKADMMRDTNYFMVKQNCLYSRDGSSLYIGTIDSSEDLAKLREASRDPDSNVYDENDRPLNKAEIQALGSFIVADAFYTFLASMDSWSFADGKFEKAMASVMKAA